MINWLIKKLTGKQRLGPNQRKWIEALRSGDYSQTVGSLQNDQGHCCLGVACEIAPNDISRKIEDGFYKGKLRGSELSVAQPKVFEWLAMCREGEDHCMQLNDSLKATFREIADTIERRPQRYFSEPK